MMLALCTALTLRRPFSSAYLKANSTMRLLPLIEIGVIEMAESGLMVAPLF